MYVKCESRDGVSMVVWQILYTPLVGTVIVIVPLVTAPP
jgi:predicted membrane protein